MYDKEPDDWIKRRRQAYDEYAQRIAERKYQHLKDNGKALQEASKRREKREVWGLIIGGIAALATIVGLVYTLFSR